MNFRKFLPTVNSPIVFSHNDLQGGNILCKESGEDGAHGNGGNSSDTSAEWENRLVVIDFEFCSYNYRAFDIANHWSEWVYDYGNEESPYYYAQSERYPSKQQQV